jgi:hypothetical protein
MDEGRERTDDQDVPIGIKAPRTSQTWGLLLLPQASFAFGPAQTSTPSIAVDNVLGREAPAPSAPTEAPKKMPTTTPMMMNLAMNKLSLENQL